MRTCASTLSLTVLGAGACAQIAGLPDYSTGGLPAQGGATPLVQTEASADEASEATGEGATGEGQGEGDAGPAEDLHPASGDDEGGSDASEPTDGGQPTDGSVPSDANLVPDGYTCGPGTCGGCCSTKGDCVGGQSVATCGVGGQKCQDCTSSGACSEGTCTTPPPDAGPPPMCVVASCSTGNCAGFPIQGACCKSDQTCGCQWTVFAPCL